MLSSALAGVFANAAVSQKVVMIALCVALPLTLVAAARATRGGASGAKWRRVVSELRIAGPALGLFTAGLNAFHMGETILRLPFNPQMKQLAPGIFEVSVLVSLGGLVGIVAAVAHIAIGFAAVSRHDASPSSR